MARRSTTSRPKASAEPKAKAPRKRGTIAADAGRHAAMRKTGTADQAASAESACGLLSPSSDMLARAEADIAAAVDSLNRQMSAAMTTLTELAITQRGRGAAVVRTAPLDRATATFQRLVAEVVDEKLAEMLPPLIGVRNEINQSRQAGGDADDDFRERSLAALDQVLALAEVQPYDARRNEPFDPLIHLAVGETAEGDLGDGVVAEAVQPGYRSLRGKVIVPARVKVNRR